MKNGLFFTELTLKTTFEGDLLDGVAFLNIHDLIFLLVTHDQVVAGVPHTSRQLTNIELRCLLELPEAGVPVEDERLLFLGDHYQAQVARSPERLVRTEVVCLLLKQLRLVQCRIGHEYPLIRQGYDHAGLHVRMHFVDFAFGAELPAVVFNRLLNDLGFVGFYGVFVEVACMPTMGYPFRRPGR